MDAFDQVHVLRPVSAVSDGDWESYSAEPYIYYSEHTNTCTHPTSCSRSTGRLIRNFRMQALIPNEPVTPLIDVVGSLVHDHSVSPVVVGDRLGDWWLVADTVIAKEANASRVVTAKVTAVIEPFPSTVVQTWLDLGLPHRAATLDLRAFLPPSALSKPVIVTRVLDRNSVDDPCCGGPEDRSVYFGAAGRDHTREQYSSSAGADGE